MCLLRKGEHIGSPLREKIDSFTHCISAVDADSAPICILLERLSTRVRAGNS